MPVVGGVWRRGRHKAYPYSWLLAPFDRLRVNGDGVCIRTGGEIPACAGMTGLGREWLRWLLRGEAAVDCHGQAGYE